MLKRLFLLIAVLAILTLPLHAQSITQTVMVGTSTVNVVTAGVGITSVEIYQSSFPLIAYTVTGGSAPGVISAGGHYVWSQVAAYSSGTTVGTVASSAGIVQFTIIQSVGGGGPTNALVPVPVIPKTCPTNQAISAIAANGLTTCSGGLNGLPTGLTYSSSIFNVAGGVVALNTDTGISRDSAGVLDIGNGTAGDKSGSVNLTALTASGSVKGAFISGNQGSALSTITPGAGWGTAASAAACTTRTGYANKSCFVITSGSASFGAAPTLTVSLPTALPSTATVYELNVHGITGAGGAILFDNTTLSTTAPVFTATTSTGAAFTPAVTETYTVVLSCGP
jgi:hypothetical protein